MQTRRFLSLILSLLAVTFVTSAARAAPAANRQLWARVLETGTAKRLALSPDGSTVYVTGCTATCGGQMQTVAYTVSTGVAKWSAGLTGTIQSLANDVTVGPDGRTVYVTGWAQHANSDPSDYQTVAYDAATGAQVWLARYDPPGNLTDAAYRVRVSPDGTHVFVTGWSSKLATGLDYATIAYDAATGAQLWVARYNGPGNGDDVPTGLGVSPDGTKVFVTGGSVGSDGNNDFATIAYDAASGDQLWLARYVDGAATPYDLAVSPDGGRLFVTGCGGGDFDFCVDASMVTTSYDAETGGQLWVETYGPPPGGAAAGRSIGVSSDSSTVFVTGYSGVGASTKYATIAYTATGSQVWVRTVQGELNGGAVGCCLAVSADGSRLIVTGYSFGVSQTYLTVAYEPTTGGKLWSASFSGGGAINSPSSVVVTKNGQVAIVTGTTIGPDGQYDWGTAAYRS